MSARWDYKVVEVPLKLFGGGQKDRIQEELDKLGAQGWELVTAHQAISESTRLYLKKSR